MGLRRTVRQDAPARETTDEELELRLAPYVVTATTIRVPHQRGSGSAARV